MRVTDFSEIANRYERNKYRHKIEQDAFLRTYIEHNNRKEYDVLDLACGTGLYLYKQIQAFQDDRIRWHGLDASEEMLQKAGEKELKAFLVKGVAERLPYEAGKFDFIVNNFAFHHFTRKAEALDEIARVLKPEGIFEMHNMAMHQMKNWWLFKYFPSAYFEDLKRFWDKDLIFHELSIRGFEVEIYISSKMQSTSVTELLGYARNRDISVLTLIDEKEYRRGLAALEAEASENPDKRITDDFADMYCIAKKLY